ncbi:MAG: response regulator transcription factor [Aphanocapsa feldmannii 277cI]|uniref:Response regulator transcription factor n=1 Tax=Aphanocapsa feldmannii 277cI TaxID=2507554 RepID=A0A524RU44_9CHRO|nr:MAG: response regulator transcription factor [Aphanocapsa feldmannii 277cI]
MENPSQTAAEDKAASPRTPAQLLLVDDEPGLRGAVEAYLQEEGFEVATASDGEEGWEKAQRLMPELVISDVMMPRLDGYGLLKRLRGNERLSGIPVIFLTAKGMTSDRIEGFMAGVDDYIPKPFDPDELVVRVRNVLSRQQRLLAEAARYADTDMQQIIEIRSLLQRGGGGGGATAMAGTVHHSFTPREASVLQLVADGLMNKEIAGRLGTSIRNVEKYVSRLFNKTELVRYALEHHLVN